MLTKVQYSRVIFVMIGLLLVALVLTPAKAAGIPFQDVPASDTHYDAIVSLYEEGLIEGTSNTTYEPYKPATRQEAALFIANALGMDIINVPDVKFTDVPKSSKYYGAIAALSEAGIINGYPDGTFKPENTLTRSQIAKILTLGFDLNVSKNIATQFQDVNAIDDLATKQYIQTLVDYKITTGKTATTFDPYGTLTRGQLATFLKRTMEATGGIAFNAVETE